MTVADYAEIFADVMLCAIFGVLLASVAFGAVVNAVRRRRWYRKDRL